MFLSNLLSGVVPTPLFLSGVVPTGLFLSGVMPTHFFSIRGNAYPSVIIRGSAYPFISSWGGAYPFVSIWAVPTLLFLSGVGPVRLPPDDPLDPLEFSQDLLLLGVDVDVCKKFTVR